MSNSKNMFNKYESMGAYHWDEIDKNSRNYNPPLEARYRVITSKIKKEKYALDIGCGDGFLMSRISSFYYLIIGIDNEMSGLREATKKLKSYENCFLVNASCYEIPFSNQYFNVAYMADVIEHLSDPNSCLNEVSRVLANDGKLFLTTPKWRPDRMWDKRHIIEYKPEELRECLMNYFEQVEMRYFWPLIWSELYSTRLGWRLLKLFSRYLYNPFLKESSHDQEKFGQIIVKCKVPIK